MKLPNPFFIGLWSIWWLATWVAIPTSLENPLVGLSLLSAFGIYETLALLSGNWRNTLSACVTAAVRKLSKHEKPFRGWNNIIPLILLPIIATIYTMMIGFMGPWMGGLVATVAAIPLSIGLHDHWLSPATHG